MGNYGQTKKAGLVPLIIGFALSLSGCGSEDNRSVEFDPVKYIQASCEFSPDEGDEYPVVRSSSPVVSGYFGKLYNKDWLLNVSHTSMRNTFEYIEKTGTKVYFSNIISAKSCKNFGFATPMPGDIAQEWNRADFRGANGEFLSGLYLIKGTRGRASLKAKAAVIIREDANRWTLVHEFMHHNFKSQALLKGYDDTLVQGSGLALAEQIEKIVNNPELKSREKVKKATPLFLEFLEIADQLVIQYSFEEIAVEATLQDKYDLGDLTYVPVASYENATWYIKHSRENAQSIYRALDSLYQTLRDMARYSGGVYKEFFLLDKHIELKEKRLAQLDAMLADREAKQLNLGHFTQMLIAAPGAEPMTGAAPCGAARQIDENVGQFQKAILRITH